VTGALIQIEGLSYSYGSSDRPEAVALRDISLDIHPGEYLSILGHNGSGKSTLARHMNALLRPTAGRVLVAGWDTRDPSRTVDIRRTVGMVFQIPDDQIVGTIVEEDVAFGPENLGLAQSEVHRRVDRALDMVGLREWRDVPTHLLSPGHKQLLAIAGMLALGPACLVLDEATALLDAEGRATVLSVLDELRRQGLAIMAITHVLDEAARTDRVIVLDEGRMVLDEPPRQAFSNRERLRRLRLDIPQVTDLAQRLHHRIPCIRPDCLEVAALSDEILEAMGKS